MHRKTVCFTKAKALLVYVKSSLRNRYSKQKKPDKQSGLHQTGENLCSLTKENKEEITQKIE